VAKNIYKNKREDLAGIIQAIFDSVQYGERSGALNNVNLLQIKEEINRLFDEYDDGTIQKGEDMLSLASDLLMAGESRKKTAKTLDKAYVNFARAKTTLRKLSDMLESLTFKIETVKDQVLETKQIEHDISKH